MEKPKANKVMKGSFWTLADRFGVMGLQFVANLVLARLLSPADFGIIGILTIFLIISETLVDGGFTSALIQKKQPTQTDFSTIFFFNAGLSLMLYLIIFACAPWIADFFHDERLCSLLRVIGLVIIVRAIPVMQIVRLKRTLSFRLMAIANISAYLLASALSIVLALRGWGVWSLVALQMINSVFVAIFLFLCDRWLPSLMFSLSALRSLFAYGGYMLGATMLEVVCKNFQGVIIGRFFSASQMGYYSQAQKLDVVSSYTPSQALIQLIFPVFSQLQDDREALHRALDKALRLTALLMFPLLGLLIFLSPKVIWLLYGDKWLPTAPYFSILCIGGLFVCLQNINFYAVAAIGRSRELMWWSFYKWSFLIVAIIVGLNFGMDGIMWGIVASNINVWLANALVNARYTGYSFGRQLRVLAAPALCLVAAVASYLFVDWVIARLPAGSFVSSSCGWILSSLAFLTVYSLPVLIFRLYRS